MRPRLGKTTVTYPLPVYKNNKKKEKEQRNSVVTLFNVVIADTFS